MEEKTSIIIIGSGSEGISLQNLLRAMAAFEVIIISEPEPLEKTMEIFPFEKFIIPSFPIEFFQVSKPKTRVKTFQEKRTKLKTKIYIRNLRIYCRRKT